MNENQIISKAMAALGRRGGRVKSLKKTAANRAKAAAYWSSPVGIARKSKCKLSEIVTDCANPL